MCLLVLMLNLKIFGKPLGMTCRGLLHAVWYVAVTNYSMFALRVQFNCQERSRLRSKRPNQISEYVVIWFIHAQRNHFVKNGVITKDSCLCSA